MVSKLIFEISTFKWGGTMALDPDRVDRRGYHVYHIWTYYTVVVASITEIKTGFRYFVRLFCALKNYSRVYMSDNL